ncbi:ipis-1-like [Dermacentor andersoni]|uniref:ipis-1-like n=1 Tax=Dermacentor andersoni TaxID=34620 RepID=UPI003B3A2398
MESQTPDEQLFNFTIDLYKHLAEKSRRTGNIFFSPFSISTALSMALAGARSTTAQQLANVLHVTSEEVHQQFSGLLSKLGGLAPDVKLHLANRMYSEQTFPVLESYLSRLRGSYDATIESVDFKNHYEEVRHRINAWVEEVTESKIKDLLPDNSVDAVTTLIIVNAIYFKGTWDSQFPPKSTCRMSFHLDSKTKRKVNMMRQKNDFMMGRLVKPAAKALEIPYRGGKASMVVLLPDKYEGLSELEDGLTAEKLSGLLNNFVLVSGVHLSLPKFKLEHSIDLKETLTSMGIKDFFTPAADLSGISDTGNLMASEVFHKAFVEVNEEGTEAAAASAIKVVPYCSSPLFNVNRPFMFFIRSIEPEAILFVGSVRDLEADECSLFSANAEAENSESSSSTPASSDDSNSELTP